MLFIRVIKSFISTFFRSIISPSFVNNNMSQYKLNKYLYVSALYLFIAILNGCAVAHHWECKKDGKVFPMCIKDGVRYCYTKDQFKGNKWFSYYERSLSCIKGGFYDNALMDLENAIQFSDKDQWWLFMYGMHYMDYFPHREKGIVHYLRSFEMPDPETELMLARVELELSIEQEPSDRASYYLNLVRKQEIELSEKKSTPEINVKIVSGLVSNDYIWTNNMPVTIEGTISDINYISEISIQGNQVYLDYSKQKNIINHPLVLPEGSHKIEIKAKNLKGHTEIEELNVLVDRSGPSINIFSFDENNHIKGFVSDVSPTISLFLIEDNIQRPVSLKDDQFSARFSHDSENLIVLAVDWLGNETRLFLKSSQNNRRIFTQLIASRDAMISSDSGASTIKTEKVNSIFLSGWSNNQVVYEKMIDIDGHVISLDRIETLSIQVKHQNKSIQYNDLLTRKNLPIKQFSFNQSIQLEENENLVIISGSDSRNRLFSKQLIVVCQTPDAFSYHERLAVVMYPFDYAEWIQKPALFGSLFPESFFRLLGPLSETKRATFQYEFSKCLTQQKRFQIKFHNWLTDYYKSLDGLNSFSHLRSFQKSHAFIIGDTNKYIDGVEIVSRLVDLRTTRIFKTLDVFVSSDQKIDMFQMAVKLSNKYHQTFPILEGDVIIGDNNKIYSAILKDNIISDWPVIIYQNSLPIQNPVTGKFLGANKTVTTDGYMQEDTSIKVRNKRAVIKINKGRVCTR